MTFTKEQFVEAYKKLPVQAKQLLGTEERSEAYQSIMKEFGLTVQEAQLVSEEAAPVLYGLVLPNDFPKNLRAQLPHLPQEKFNALITKIDAVVFAPIRSAIISATHESHAGQPTAPIHIAPRSSSVIPQQTAVTPITQAPQATPGLTRTLPADIAQTKLEQSFRMPSTTTVINETKPVAPKQPDPYREAVE